MWRRSSRGSSAPPDAPRRRLLAAFGCAIAVTLAALAPAPAHAQVDESFNPLDVDPVTREILTNAFTRLRFLAILIEGEDETGQALNGIVRARLARGERADAMDEVTRIDDPIWAGRSLVSIAKHDRARGAVEEARQPCAGPAPISRAWPRRRSVMGARCCVSSRSTRRGSATGRGRSPPRA